MVPERKQGGNFMKDREINVESNVWSTAQRWNKIYGLDVDAGFELNHRSVGYFRQYLLV